MTSHHRRSSSPCWATLAAPSAPRCSSAPPRRRPASPAPVDRSDVAFAGVAGQAELLRRGDVTSRELTQISVDRIAALDRRLNAFNAVYEERALAEADAADRRLRDGDRAPLLGVPIAIKDEVDIAGEVT